jgi:hypothetical protein
MAMGTVIRKRGNRQFIPTPKGGVSLSGKIDDVYRTQEVFCFEEFAHMSENPEKIALIHNEYERLMRREVRFY